MEGEREEGEGRKGRGGRGGEEREGGEGRGEREGRGGEERRGRGRRGRGRGREGRGGEERFMERYLKGTMWSGFGLSKHPGLTAIAVSSWLDTHLPLRALEPAHPT